MANYLRSGLHGAGIALAGWAVQAAFASNTRSSLRSAFRRLPISVEIVVRSLVMTIALILAGIALQLVLYAGRLGLHWVTIGWFAKTLAWIVAIGFALSLTIGAVTEIGRLVDVEK